METLTVAVLVQREGDKPMNLKQTKTLVRYILSKYEDARNSDMALYLRVCEIRNEQSLTMPFYEVLQNLKELNLPPFESVRRARQKVQEENAVFDADEIIQRYRAENEAEYRAFARGGV